ncbi:uncharacterized protein [Coffea arabica]|uniref:Retrotransposon gag domain-containing protein n=1 Tax=Coffea arabica TaxID=13443 RepID=A0ABM4UQU7_COFAR
MSSQPEQSDRSATTAQPETASLGIQLTEMLTKFGEMASEMAAQRKLDDELISSGVQPEPVPARQPEQEPFVLPSAHATVTPSFPIAPEETFTYPTTNLPYTYPPHPSFFLTHMRGPQPQIISNIPPEPHTFYYPAAEPFLPDHTFQTKPEMGESSAPVDMKLLKRLDRFDEFIRKSQGLNKQGVLDYDELCLFPNVQLPEGFKTPKFNKYDGTGNPKTHLRLFANKLGRPTDDENLPLRLFPESLEGDALDWYSKLKPEEAKTWLDLSNAFVKQYEYNCELAPTRTTLEGTKRKPSEDHKTYAKRWRKIAAKVEPPMTEHEIIRTFIKAHDPPYFEEIFRMTGCSFAAIVNKLEEYDDFVKAGKIVNVSTLKSQLDALQGQGTSGKNPQFQKKEGETTFTWSQNPVPRPRLQQYPTYSNPYPYYSNPHPVYHTNITHPRPRSNYANPPTTPFQIFQPSFQQTRPRPPYHQRFSLPNRPTYNYPRSTETYNQSRTRTFANLGRPLDQLYEQLKAANKIGVIPPPTYLHGMPAGYNPHAICAYHSGVPGHSTVDCRALKHKVQDMIEAGEIMLRKRGEQGPSISTNPFPEHKDTFEASTSNDEI